MWHASRRCPVGLIKLWVQMLILTAEPYDSPVSNELIELLVDLIEALLKTDPVVDLHGGGFVQHLVQVAL